MTRPRFAFTSLLFLGVVMSGPGSALAQDTGVAINQTNTARPGRPEATAAAQIGPRVPALPPAAPTARDRSVSGSVAPPPAPVPAAQVTGERGQAYSRLDLRAVEPSAEAPASPARRADGRDTTTVVPAGPDRCDPQRAPLPVACDRVIEARAGEFSEPDHQPLSAEQRLLATQRELRPTTIDVGTAARRLANGQIDDSNAALAVASMTLQRPAGPDEEEETPTDTSAIDAIVSGITSMVTGGAPPNP